MLKPILMDMSGIYLQDDYFGSDPDRNLFEVLSLRHLKGTDGYCSEEAAAVLKKTIAGLAIKKERSKAEDSAENISRIHFLDNGNFHYLSLFFLELVKEPFQLLVFDHHTDMQPSGLLPLLSCGSWVLHTLEENDFLKRVVLIGPPREDYLRIPEGCRKKILWIPEDADPDKMIYSISAGFSNQEKVFGTLPVYLSIDKDILCVADCPSNWDQGNMKTERLEEWLEIIGSQCRIAGCDICGAPAYGESCDRNRETDLQIWKTVSCFMEHDL